MKIQYIAVIFIIIIIPIALVSSSYIGSQIDTIRLQTQYDTKLNDSTYDAVKAFQINTVNNRYSSISDSKIRDIEASVNAFYNSLSNNESRSKDELKEFVPALVYTLYDGYYIYTKYDNVYPVDNGQPITDEDVLKQNDANFGLKPYIYYSCRYVKDNIDVVVNYTLDNAITIYGQFGDKYKTLSGYLINPDLVKNVTYEENQNISSWKLDYNGITITPETLEEHLLFVDETSGDYTYLTYNGQKIYYDKDYNPDDTETKYFRYQNYKKSYITNSTLNTKLKEFLDKRVWNDKIHSTSAFEYYYKAKIFSEKVNDRMKDITQGDAKDAEGNPITFSVNTGTNPIFATSNNNDPLISGSTFDENRMAVIRKSIETNLSAAIAQYNDFSNNAYEYALPVLNEVDWYKIENNVSVISFLQGLPIGHKYYNNYCVITNNNNEETVKKENIYIITKNSNTCYEYHHPGCKRIMDTNQGFTNIEENAYSNVNFLRQTVRISEGNYKYFYPQSRVKNNSGDVYEITSCYDCMVNAAFTYDVDDIIEEKMPDGDHTNLDTIRQRYIHALARERYDLYQLNMDQMQMDET